MSKPTPQFLITRAPERVQRLTEKVASLGWETVACETVEIAAAGDDKTLVQRVQCLSDSDIVIFVSQNAVDYLFRYRSDYPDEVTTLAVGPATERALAVHGVHTSVSPQPPYNSEALLALPALQAVREQRVVIVAGEGGRETLETTLSARGAHVTKLALYRRSCPQKNLADALPQWKTQVQLVVGTSAASLRNLLSLAGKSKPWLRSLPLIVVSSRLADIAREQLGFQGAVSVAHDASEEGLARSVASYILRLRSCNKDAS